MTNEELILQKIEKLESRIEPLVKSADNLIELKKTTLSHWEIMLLYF